ncbi:hypothetical protein GOBAR_AA34686 [Gossypium barbadense]|uniref:Uncharacterized protein n=1 Tax=Gossypium barbadense TaxID=3634 RepID=A0A2P5W4G3_GOSBA|nr:hypothetical protein GOBAR_AA34686 [Gossypium barbadense]
MSNATCFFSSTKSNPCLRSQKPRQPSFGNRCLLMAKQQKTRILRFCSKEETEEFEEKKRESSAGKRD